MHSVNLASSTRPRASGAFMRSSPGQKTNAAAKRAGTVGAIPLTTTSSMAKSNNNNDDDNDAASSSLQPSRRATLFAAAAAASTLPLPLLSFPHRAEAIQGLTAGRIPGLSAQPDASTGLYTYVRPEGKSGGHGVGWSEIPRYGFKVPGGWDETPVSIADLGGTEIDLRFGNPEQGQVRERVLWSEKEFSFFLSFFFF